MVTQLATRCPACSTVFRVVPDQLRVSDGWVRCGRCAEVFNAGERLVDLDTGAPRRAPAEALPAEATPRREPPRAAANLNLDGPPATASAPGTDELAYVAETSAAPPDAAADTSSSAPSGYEADPVAEQTTQPWSAIDPGEAPAGPGGTPQTPSFVLRAERAARWRRPGVRAALSLVVLVGALGLAGQLAYEWRDLIAARYTGTRPLLDEGCRLLGCRVGAAHVIDGLAVDSSGLVRVEKSSLYRVSVALRNRSDIELALPAFDLTLTDGGGALLARRVLRATELGASQTTLAAGRDLLLQATLQAGSEPVAGYTIEIFYP